MELYLQLDCWQTLKIWILWDCLHVIHQHYDVLGTYYYNHLQQHLGSRGALSLLRIAFSFKGSKAEICECFKWSNWSIIWIPATKTYEYWSVHCLERTKFKRFLRAIYENAKRFIYLEGSFNCNVITSRRSRPVWWDLDPLQEIWIGARYGPNALAIRKPTHGMIRRSVPVRAVKTRRRFGSKTASFYVSVCLLVYF